MLVRWCHISCYCLRSMNDSLPSQTQPSLIPITDFIQTLFGKSLCQDITRRMETGTAINKLWKSAMVFFNHFANLRNPPTMKASEDAFRRGAAFFLPPNFPGADLLIPIYITVSITRVSAIQVKNRKNDEFTAPVKSQAVARGG